MRVMDFSSWQSIVLTIGGLALVTLIGVGVRLIAMMTIQQRRSSSVRPAKQRSVIRFCTPRFQVGVRVVAQ